MTLLTRHIDAGWHEVEWRGPRGHVAEKFHAQPGATSTVLRIEAPTQDELHRQIDLRESQLSNDQSHVIWPSGTRVTDAEHSAAQIMGVAPVTRLEDTDAEAAVVVQQAALVESAVEADAVQNGPSSADLDTQTRLAEGTVTPLVPPAEGSLSDEERAKLRADEDELEDGKVDGVEPPLDPTQLSG